MQGRTRRSGPAPLFVKGPMRHRTYSGKIAYLRDGVTERGREWFTVTVHGDGRRTAHTMVEMEDHGLLRDSTQSVDAAWYPTDAYVRLSLADAFVGAAWYRFGDTWAECENTTAAAGRAGFRQEVGVRPPLFGTHALLNDGWLVAAFDRDRQGCKRHTCTAGFVCSPTPDGSTGPDLNRIDLTQTHLGEEDVTVPAGTFHARHTQYVFPHRPPIDYWTTLDDFVPLRVRSTQLQSTYDLIDFDPG